MADSNSALSWGPLGVLFLVSFSATCGDNWADGSPGPECSTDVRLVAELGDLDDPASVREPILVDIAHLPGGGWVVAEDGNDLIEYSPDGSFRGFFGSRGEGPGEIWGPRALAVDNSDSLWVSAYRGRVVVFGADGSPARTIIRPGLFPVHGFTASNLPFSMLTRTSGAPDPDPLAFGFAQVWSRDGDSLHALGPGNFDPLAAGRVVLPLMPRQSLLVSDSVLFTPGGWLNWVSRWTASSTEALAPASTVWQRLGLGDGPTLPGDSHPIAVISDGEDGFWVLGAIRRLEKEEEVALSRAQNSEGAARISLFRSFAPSLRNEVFDGALVHFSGEGVATEGATFEEYPFGFVDPGTFFTFRPLTSGLIQIRIWRFSQNCG